MSGLTRYFSVSLCDPLHDEIQLTCYNITYAKGMTVTVILLQYSIDKDNPNFGSHFTEHDSVILAQSCCCCARRSLQEKIIYR